MLTNLSFKTIILGQFLLARKKRSLSMLLPVAAISVKFIGLIPLTWFVVGKRIGSEMKTSRFISSMVDYVRKWVK